MNEANAPETEKDKVTTQTFIHFLYFFQTEKGKANGQQHELKLKAGESKLPFLFFLPDAETAERDYSEVSQTLPTPPVRIRYKTVSLVNQRIEKWLELAEAQKGAPSESTRRTAHYLIQYHRQQCG